MNLFYIIATLARDPECFEPRQPIVFGPYTMAPGQRTYATLVAHVYEAALRVEDYFSKVMQPGESLTLEVRS